jgi:hypothetical protein
MTQDLWGTVLTTLADHLNMFRRDLPVLILADQPNCCHVNVDVLESLIEQDIFVLFFPHNSSHILQPLDDAPFARFKEEYRNFIHRKSIGAILQSTNPKPTGSFIDDAEHQSFHRETIIAGFSKRGLWPFDKEKVRSNVRKTLARIEKPVSNEVQKLAAEAHDELVKLSQSSINSKQARVRGIPKKSQLMDAIELVEFTRQKEREKQAAREAKELKRQEKKAAKEKRIRELNDKRERGKKRGREEGEAIESPRPPQETANRSGILFKLWLHIPRKRSMVVLLQ